MTDPSKMCRKHLLGEHVEIHMFIGSIIKGISMTGYIEGDLLEPSSLKKRHLELVAEMQRRGYVHKSEVGESSAYLRSLIVASGVNYHHRIAVDLAKTELLRRCPDCRRLHNVKS